MANFSQALALIREEEESVERCLVAIDQPTIVPNLTGSRPADKVAASLISWIGGGVQPANRSKIRMFDDAAPIWLFKHALDAIEDPERARVAKSGLFIIEVFPALALSALEERFHAQLAGPRCNPSRRKNFNLQDWIGVIDVVDSFGRTRGIEGLDVWCDTHRLLPAPRKPDLDRLDAVLCALVGLHWLTADRSQSIMIGEFQQGYMMTPASDTVRTRLGNAARLQGVPIDGESRQ